MTSRLALYLRMIKFSHSIFALPFAFTAALLAAGGIPEARTILWITIAMVSGRSAAMGLNRLIDRKIDAKNPRTSEREIPSGKVSIRDAIIFVLVSSIVFVFSAYMLNPLCLYLSPVALLCFFIYPYTKRFTHLSHVFLGLTISGAPLGAWIAVTGGVEPRILLLVFAVIFWLSGFDILYALQDEEFDRHAGLHSIPARFGKEKAILISRLFHLTTWLFLFGTGLLFGLGWPYMAGVFLSGFLLLYEHSLVRPDDLSKLNIAFFNMNGYISITVFCGTLLNYILL
ncbi:MAG: 4-hydroxybenzoate octaprenyltransferase [Nitrospirae bacterium]|nr:MAG: 4-hydroxybenzoate octaprenyltransferase [Nitrospirota bacterium]